MAAISNGDRCLCSDLACRIRTQMLHYIARSSGEHSFLDILILFSLPDVLFDRLIDVLMHVTLS
jgi:hypothetical protein